MSIKDYLCFKKIKSNKKINKRRNNNSRHADNTNIGCSNTNFKIVMINVNMWFICLIGNCVWNEQGCTNSHMLITYKL